MGLDMYLKVKYRPQNKLEAINAEANKKTNLTGACGGLFGIAPDDNGCEEIGYWRKAYDQRRLFEGTLASYEEAEEDNCVDFLITREEVDTILEAAKAEVKEIEDAYRDYRQEFPDEKCDIDDYGDNFSTENTWGNYGKWKDTVEFFTRAKELYALYSDAEIYFEQWY